MNMNHSMVKFKRFLLLILVLVLVGCQSSVQQSSLQSPFTVGLIITSSTSSANRSKVVFVDHDLKKVGEDILPLAPMGESWSNPVTLGKTIVFPMSLKKTGGNEKFIVFDQQEKNYRTFSVGTVVPQSVAIDTDSVYAAGNANGATELHRWNRSNGVLEKTRRVEKAYKMTDAIFPFDKGLYVLENDLGEFGTVPSLVRYTRDLKEEERIPLEAYGASFFAASERDGKIYIPFVRKKEEDDAGEVKTKKGQDQIVVFDQKTKKLDAWPLKAEPGLVQPFMEHLLVLHDLMERPDTKSRVSLLDRKTGKILHFLTMDGHLSYVVSRGTDLYAIVAHGDGKGDALVHYRWDGEKFRRVIEEKIPVPEDYYISQLFLSVE